MPDPPRRLRLPAVRLALEKEGIPVIDARVMLIAGSDPEVTISQNGRLLIKTPDATTADRTFARLLPLIEKASDASI